MISPQASSVRLNYPLLKFSLFNKVVSKYVSGRRYLAMGELRWRKQTESRKLLKKVMLTFERIPRLGQSSCTFSPDCNPYFITVTDLKATLNSKDYIIRKTVGRPKNVIPLSEIRFGRAEGFWPSPRHSPAPHTGKYLKHIQTYNRPSQEADQSNRHYAFPRNNQHFNTTSVLSNSHKNNGSDILILNPQNPDSRMILHFRNKNIHIIEPSNFDHLNLAYQHIMRINQTFLYNAPGRIFFTSFEKVAINNLIRASKISELKSFQEAEDLSYSILKKEESAPLEDNSNKCWIPISNERDSTSSPIKEELLSLSSTQDNKSDIYITKIPIKKDTLIEENVIPNQSILNIINSIDKSAVIIHKDLYITNRIIQSIKDEEKKKDKNVLETKGLFANGSVVLHLVVISNNVKSESTHINNVNCNQDDLLSQVNDILKPETDGMYLVKSTKANGRLELFFTLVGRPDLQKTPTTTDCINKAAAIIEKEKYHQRKLDEEDKEKSKQILREERDLKKLERIKPEKSEGIDKYSLPLETAWSDSPLLVTLCEGSKGLQNGKDTNSDSNAELNTLGSPGEGISSTDTNADPAVNLSIHPHIGEGISSTDTNADPAVNLSSSTDTNADPAVNLSTHAHIGEGISSTDTSADPAVNLSIHPHIGEGISSTGENITSDGRPNPSINYPSHSNNLDHQLLPKPTKKETTSAHDCTILFPRIKPISENEYNGAHQPEKCVNNNKINISNSSTTENLASFECGSLVDNSIKCLMSSQGKNGKNKVNLGNEAKNINIKFPTGGNNTGGHSSMTNITVYKNNNLTDINISEKEIFTDPRIPVSFSTETSFQIVGSNPKVHKEMDLFEKAKSMIVSSIVQTKLDNNSFNKDLTSAKSIPNYKSQSADLSSFSKKGDEPPSKSKTISTPKNEKRKKAFKRTRTRQNRLYNGKNLPPDINKLEGNVDTKREAKNKIKSQDEVVKENKEIKLNEKSSIIENKKEPQKNESEQKINNDNFINLLPGSSNKVITSKPKKLKGITEHKSLSKRDKLILKEILKSNKNKKIKQKRDSGGIKSLSTIDTFKAHKEKLESSKVKMNKRSAKIAIKQKSPTGKETKVKPILLSKNAKPCSGQEEIKTVQSEVKPLSSTEQSSKVEKKQTDSKSVKENHENKQDSNITNSNLLFKNMPKTIENQINVVEVKARPETNIAERMSLRTSERNDGSTSVTFGPSAGNAKTQGSIGSELPLDKPPEINISSIGTNYKQTDKPISGNNKVVDKTNSEIIIIEHSKNSVQDESKDHKESFKDNLLSKIKSKIESKNPINYRAKKEKDTSTYNQKLSGNDTVQKKLEVKISSNGQSDHTNKNKFNKETSKTSTLLKTDKPPVKNVSQGKEAVFNKKTLVTKNVTKNKAGSNKKSQERKTKKHLSPTISRDISHALNSPKGSKKHIKRIPQLAMKQEQAEAKSPNKEKKNMVTGKPGVMPKQNIEERSKVIQGKGDVAKEGSFLLGSTKRKQMAASEKGATDLKSKLSDKPTKKSSISPPEDSHIPAEGIFPTLIVDIDKMNKEIKPNLNIKQCRTCSLTPEKFMQFPIWNSKVVQQHSNPRSVIKVCPSKDPQLNNELAKLPSVTKVLNVTLPKKSKELLKTWWRDKMKNTGEEGFKSMYKGEMGSGTQFHNLIQDQLLWGHGGGSPSSPSFRSLHHILHEIKGLSVLNSHVVHNTLAYRGVVDCVATFKRKPVVIEWKRLNRREFRSKAALDSAFQQLAAYIGAINFDSNYKLQVKNGLLVLAYNDGSQADHFLLSQPDCELYWKLWLERLHRYHAYIKNKQNKQ